MADASFNEFVREQLAGLPGVEFRRMFGGRWPNGSAVAAEMPGAVPAFDTRPLRH